jgi:glycine cleavage system regulatory protein
MNTSIVLTIIARDQPGIIQKVSGLLHRHGGSWSQSSMSSLAGYFAGMLLASVPEANAEACVTELKALEAEGIRVIANLSDEAPSQAETHQYSLHLVGNDHPGIVRDITRVLYRHQVNVLMLETITEAASMAGAELFRAKAQLTIPAGIDVDALEKELEDVANDLMVDIDFMK